MVLGPFAETKGPRPPVREPAVNDFGFQFLPFSNLIPKNKNRPYQDRLKLFKALKSNPQPRPPNGASGGLQCEIDMYGIVRKLNETFFCLFQDAGIQ
jgi:hypothetical protein